MVVNATRGASLDAFQGHDLSDRFADTCAAVQVCPSGAHVRQDLQYQRKNHGFKQCRHRHQGQAARLRQFMFWCAKLLMICCTQRGA